MHQDEFMDVNNCTGSLIHPSVVLTAAHCIKNASLQIIVRAGEWDTQTDKEPYPYQDRIVDEIVMHEHYQKANLHNDFALLFVKEPFKLGNNVNTVCLPQPNEHFDRARCIVSGWGRDKFRKGAYQAILKRIKVPVVPHDECQTLLRDTRLGKHFILNESFLCAGGEFEKDACRGK